MDIRHDTGREAELRIAALRFLVLSVLVVGLTLLGIKRSYAEMPAPVKACATPCAADR